MPKQIAATTMEGITKMERPHKRWTHGVEEDINITQIENRQAMGQRPSGME
jgi:hypothetical protein